MAEQAPMPMCPMAGMCRRMMKQSRPRYALVIPGILLIILGLTVLVEPRILVWLVAIALIMLGSAILMMTKLIRSIGEEISGR